MAALALPAVAAEPQTIATEGFGCLALRDFERAVQFADQDDAEAFKKFVEQKGETGDCRSLHKGQSVFLENTSGSGRICVRPKGDIECLWTGSTIVE
ncbi:hypothetical protein NKL07_22035 [Mesorhizobium sp. C280B]|uniref:hypothetical protein n=1 Tax=Mesorhizobium sp. C280B TaxID=2956828 RepID=UPI003338683B